MTVVTTGAAGFIGRHVVSLIRRRGIEVVGIDRRTWTPMTGEVAIVSDVAEPDPVVDRMLRRATGVVHLAACAGVRDQGPDVAMRRWRDNVVAGARVLEVTPTSTMIVVASSSVYGGAGPVDRLRPCREDDRVAPQGGYARSKWALEWRAKRRAAAGGAVGVCDPSPSPGRVSDPTWRSAGGSPHCRSGVRLCGTAVATDVVTSPMSPMSPRASSGCSTDASRRP